MRPFRVNDLRVVAPMWLRAFQRPGTAAGVQRYFREVFLDQLPAGEPSASLVHEDDAGAITGFVGAIPRRMSYRGRPIRALVATQLMVDPARRRALAAFDLLRALFSGPQDLTFCDGANDRSQRVWERSGGEVVRLYCLDWIRVLRPLGHVHQRVVRSGRARLARVTAPFCRAADALAGGLMGLDSAAAVGLALGRPRARLVDEDLSAAAARSILEAGQPAPSLGPIHDDTSLARRLDQAARTRGNGPLRRRLCRDRSGEAVGFYVYYARPGGLAQVLQIAGRSSAIRDVIGSLLADAYRAGSVAVVGQADPRILRELTDAHATFGCPSLGVLAHAKDRQILDAFQRGDASISRLDGEWWLRFAADALVD